MLSKFEIMKINDTSKYKVRLITCMWESKLGPTRRIAWEGDTKFSIRRNTSGELDFFIPVDSPVDWPGYVPKEIVDWGGCLTGEYMMEIIEEV